MSRQISAVTIIGALALMVGGCSTAPKSESDRSQLNTEAAATVDHAQKKDPGLKTFMDSAAGYAVFPSIGKGGLVVGGAYGKGVLYENGTIVGYCDMTQGSVGLQAGGQSYSEIVCFKDKAALDNFKSGKFALAAQATAVAVAAGAGANAKYQEGVAVFTLSEEGLMAEASIGGQNFAYVPK